jgi:hypothetical protein
MTMTEPGQDLSPRLKQFQAEVNDLKVTGGKANPERTWRILSGIALVLGVVLSLVAWLGTRSTTNALEIADYNAMGNFGLTLAIAGGAVFIVTSLTRYFRFWLVRLIYEQREQTDRMLSGR